MPASRAQRAAAADKRKKAVALKLAGMDWQSIADQVGYASPGAACTAVSEALKANIREQSELVAELRDVETARLDRLQAAFWPKALKGDVKAAEVVHKCIMSRAKLQGTEAAVRTEISGPGGGAIPFSGSELAEIEALIAISEQDTGGLAPTQYGSDDSNG